MAHAWHPEASASRALVFSLHGRAVTKAVGLKGVPVRGVACSQRGSVRVGRGAGSSRASSRGCVSHVPLWLGRLLSQTRQLAVEGDAAHAARTARAASAQDALDQHLALLREPQFLPEALNLLIVACGRAGQLCWAEPGLTTGLTTGAGGWWGRTAGMARPDLCRHPLPQPRTSCSVEPAHQLGAAKRDDPRAAALTAAATPPHHPKPSRTPPRLGPLPPAHPPHPHTKTMHTLPPAPHPPTHPPRPAPPPPRSRPPCTTMSVVCSSSEVTIFTLNSSVRSAFCQ